MISIIAAVGKNLELGHNNKLIWNIKDDMKYFRDTTINHSVIVGLNTFKSFPNGLKDRKIFVLTDLIESDPDKNIFATVDIDGLINEYKNSLDEVFVIGGAYVYSEFIDVADKIYLTEIDATCNDADVYFPEFDKRMYKKRIIKSGTYEDINYQMCVYEKDNILLT